MQEKLARAIDKEMNLRKFEFNSSVEPERVFYDMEEPFFKIKSTVHDESLDMLSFLREYFKTENN
jgi:hypothetical protein